MALSQARVEENYDYCQSIKNRCSDEGHELHDMLEHFINTVRVSSRICFPTSVDARRAVVKCMRHIRSLPGCFPDDFTLNHDDATLGASMVEFIGDAMQDLRHRFPQIAFHDEKVVTSYWYLCKLLRCKFTLRFDRDGSKREVDPDRNRFHDEDAPYVGLPSSQLRWGYGWTNHERDDEDDIWGARVDAEYWLEHLRPIAPA